MINHSAETSVLPEDAGWYLFHRHDCHGPFTRNQVVMLISKKKIDASWMVMRDGWAEWRSVVDCIGELANSKGPDGTVERKRLGAPRAKVRASVTAASSHAKANAKCCNISVSGIFITTTGTPFRLGEQVELRIHAAELKEPFVAKAEVTRYNDDRRFDVGYGLKFLDIPSSAVLDIARLVGYRSSQAFGEVVYSYPFSRPKKPSRKAG